MLMALLVFLAAGTLAFAVMALVARARLGQAPRRRASSDEALARRAAAARCAIPA